jgi:heat-inducible transcriptional repressor
MKTINARSLEILDAVVRLNIETGRAVSSGLVARLMTTSVSPATIRSVMKSLEDEGYLEQPHTSAGRLPTDLGYRVFVDRLRSGWALRTRVIPEEMQLEARRDLDRSVGHPDRIGIMARLLSRLTTNISIIVGPSLDNVRALRVELYPRSSRRLLMVVILGNSQVRTGMVEIPQSQPDVVIQQAARLISERVTGRTVGEIRSGALEWVDLVRTPVTQCAAALLRQGKDLFHDTQQGEVQLEGVSTVLSEPEFSDPEPLKALLRFIESPSAIRTALDRLDGESKNGVGVWIGQENPLNELQQFSMLTGRFDLDGRQGMLAVLGPRRMWYQRAFLGIDAMQQVMNITR